MDSQPTWLRSCARLETFGDPDFPPPVSDRLAATGVCLSTSPSLKEEQVRFMAEKIDEAFRSLGL